MFILLRKPLFMSRSHRPASVSPRSLRTRQTHLRSLLVSVLGAAVPISLTAGLLYSGVAAAQTQPAQRQFAIPAGPLGDVLLRFSSETGVFFIGASPSSPQTRSPGVQGSYSVDQALRQLLQGTDLEPQQQHDGSYILKAMPPRTGPGARELEPIQVKARRDAITEGHDRYTQDYVSMGKGQLLRDIPQSVTVVTRAQIEDQNLTNLTEVLDKTAGVTVNKAGTLSGISHGNDSVFSSRGFVLSNMQIDGGAAMDTAMSGFGSISQLDMAQFDHVEFLRGVDGLFSSTGEPGGTVNLVRKKPLAETRMNFSATAGSWDYYRMDGDVGGALNESGSLRGRLGVGQEDRHYFYDTAKSHKSLVYGALAADLGPDTQLTVGGSYQRSNGILSVGGLPRYSNGEDLGLPRRTALTTDWSRSKEIAAQAYAQLEHQLNPDWKLSADAMYLDIQRDASIVYTYGAVDMDGQGGPRWYSYPADSKMKRWAVNLNLSGDFEAFAQQHKVVVGADYSRADSVGVQRYNGMSGTEANVFDVHGPADQGTIPGKDDHRLATRSALYASLRLGLSERVKFIVGGRYSSYAFSTHNTQWNPDGSVARTQDLGKRRTNGVYTPYYGLTYELSPNWTAYASYSTTFNPQDTLLGGPLPGTPISPMKSRNYELGLKGELIPEQLNASMALYRMERRGEGVEDSRFEPIYDIATCCYVNQGKVVSQGIDLELNGAITPDWHVVAGYTYNSNRDQNEEVGRFSSVTPRHLFKLWTTYRLPANLNQWRVGAGVNLQSANYTQGYAASYNPGSGKWDGEDQPYQFRQGGYAVWNASVDYQFDKRWSLSLNVNNLFDKTYYQTVGTSGFGNFYGEPRNYALTLRGRF